MSGTKEKATGKQSAKGRAGKVSAQEVAQADASDLPGAERSVTLPGHYVAVGASPVSLKPGDAGAPPSSDDVITLTGDNVSISAPAVHISADHLNTVQRELMKRRSGGRWSGQCCHANRACNRRCCGAGGSRQT